MENKRIIIIEGEFTIKGDLKLSNVKQPLKELVLELDEPIHIRPIRLKSKEEVKVKSSL